MTYKTYARITALVAAGFLVISGSAAFADTDVPGNDCGNTGAQCDDSGPFSPSPTPSPGPEDEEEEKKEEEDRGNAPGYEESPSGEPSEGEHVPGYEQTPEPPESTEPAESEEPPEDGESGHGPSDEEAPGDEPEQPEQHVPSSQASEQHVDRYAAGATSSTASSAPDDRDLALTGTDASGLGWLIAVAATAIAAGAALLVGLRRRSHS